MIIHNYLKKYSLYIIIMNNQLNDTNEKLENLYNIVKTQNIEIQQLNNELSCYKNHILVLNTIIKNCQYHDIICGDI